MPFGLDFISKASTINPEQSDLCPYCLPFSLHCTFENKQVIKIETGGKRVNKAVFSKHKL